ncbi:hypothetical protein ABW20_dc0105603 [Dactylellina cionopaga]|nr:hypothetical protein ABW20_dc0105603 [Dactylellina cionopaga]
MSAAITGYFQPANNDKLPEVETRQEMMMRIYAAVTTRKLAVAYQTTVQWDSNRIITYHCPRIGCDAQFYDKKDRNDHAHWRHGWCFECCKFYDDVIGLEESCVPGCREKFEKPSHLFEHLESNVCQVTIDKVVTDHWIGHLILLEHSENFTNDEKVCFAGLDLKVITIKKDNPWIIDPLSKFYETVKGCELSSRLTYAWEMWGEHRSGRIITDRKYTCLCCGEKWGDAPWFFSHMRGGEEDAMFVIWQCESCEAGFKCLSGLADHYEMGCNFQLGEMEEMRERCVTEFEYGDDEQDPSAESGLTGLEAYMEDMEVD